MQRDPARIERRDFLRAGACGLAVNAGLGSVARAANSGTARSGAAKSCILVYLVGGPPHIDMWDPKPEAPAEIRGPFRPVSTSVPGTFFTDQLPRLSQQAHRFAVLRSLSHDNHDHPFMMYYTLTGRISSVPLGANTVLPPTRTDDPHMGAIVAKYKHRDPNVPGYVAIPEVSVRMSPELVAGGGRAGFLGPKFDPLPINDDPSKPITSLDLPAEVSAQRFVGRKQLLGVLESDSATRLSGSYRADEYSTTRRTALSLTRTTPTEGLFSLDTEPAALREKYGRDRFGQSLLLARRLVERGVSFVGVHFNHMTKCDGWDTHKKNFECLEKELLPMLDRGLSVLIDDLAERGLLDETLVVTMGEFGRTPRVNSDGGRDHWGHCGSVVFAGGGVSGGTVVGASDRIGAFPTSRPVGPPDISATIFHALGMNPEGLMYDGLNRPHPLSSGRPIVDLFA
ncbi:MAG: DUF1501 domain-containing protein [Planctomycetaceae bacterium]